MSHLHNLPISSNTLRLQLCAAITQLSDRGLFQASRWAAELLVAVASSEIHNFNNEEQISKSTPVAVPATSSKTHVALQDPSLDVEKLLLAKAYLQLREYDRVAHLLSTCALTNTKALFIRYYARYLAAEKKREEMQSFGDRHKSVNKELFSLRTELSELYTRVRLYHDGFCLYLYGWILHECAADEEARQVLIESVTAYPWNWSAWLALATVCTERDYTQLSSLLGGITPEAQWITWFFKAHLAMELQHNRDALVLLQSLTQSFPTHTELRTLIATVQYNLQEFDSAEKTFEQIRQEDPYCLHRLDVYSNILYVKEDTPRLSALVHDAVAIDKYTPETCCILGNYYSLKGDHVRALVSFRRALMLNVYYLAAWTLMGHEYLELKQTAHAVYAYRQAVNLSRERDYRAWYGLGQTYELLQLPLYALHYYQRAAALRPYDARMWCAVAGCYEQLLATTPPQLHSVRLTKAIQCYLLAESCAATDDDVALHKLAQLYSRLGNVTKAAYFYKRSLDKRDREGVEVIEIVEALLFLARYCLAQGHLLDAEKYATRLLDYAGKEKEEAKALLREIHSTQK
jgi:anaphase-promoting complex subunit 8